MNKSVRAARPLAKLTRRDMRVAELTAENAELRRQVSRFHALLIAERVSKIGTRTNLQGAPGSPSHGRNGEPLCSGAHQWGATGSDTTFNGGGRTTPDGSSAATPTGGAL